jgi:hypothetical protein
MQAAPIRLLKLEFVLPEEKFDLQMTKAEQVVKQNQQQLASNTNVKDALQKHRVGTLIGQLMRMLKYSETCE